MKHRFLTFILTIISLFSFSQVPQVSSGTIRRFENFPSKHVDARNIDVWLPENYDPKKKYAVIYMHDGQMLFDSTSTWNHQEWGVDETLSRLMAEKKIRDCMVVGVSNNGMKRAAEYFPEKAIVHFPDSTRKEMLPLIGNTPLADHYLTFLVKELKPFIDSAYSTRPDLQNTFIAGSSYGGLISMYAICEYPHVFGGAACLSTHWPGGYKANEAIPQALFKYLGEHLPAPKNHKLYFDQGTTTIDSLYAPYQQRADEIFRSQGYTSSNFKSEVFSGEPHTEIAWRKRFEIPAIFLLKK